MVEKMSSDSGNRATNALHRRAKAIKDWEISPTSKEKPVRLPNQFTIQFDQGTVFLSAVASGDIEETKNLLDSGVEIDYTNVDGLTALHQACIDENDEMVKLLLDRGANIEARDNEGWTPLHAAASAGNIDIAQILIDYNADLAAVNNEGEVPLDLAEEEEMEDFLSDEIDAQNLEVEDARNEEERVMIEDANSWINQNKVDEVLDWQGATALHVAASKGYNKVISLILQIPTIDVNVRDDDGWTPLHAAVHWGSKTATELLTEAGANFDIKNNNGQTPCDLAEPEFVKTAETCRKRSKEISKKPTFTKNKRIDVSIDVNDNSIHERELLAIGNLKKEPSRSALKGGREKAKNGNSISIKTNDNDNKKTEISVSGESDQPSDIDTKSTVKVSLNTSKPESVTITTKFSTSREESNDKIISPNSRSTAKQEPVKVEPKKEESVRSSVSSRLNRPFTTTPTGNKTEEKKPEGGIANRYRFGSSKDEKENETPNKTYSRTNTHRDKDKANVDTTSNTPSTVTTNSIFTRTTGGSDWRSRLAERSKDAENDQLYSRATSYSNETVSSQNEQETQSDTFSPSSRRVLHKNLRETRRSTGVVFLPGQEETTKEDENDSTATTTTTTTTPETTDNSRLSIAERLRKKNEQLIASSTSDRTSSSSSSYTDRYTSSSRGDRDSYSSANTPSLNKSRLSSASTNSADTNGDTKELQRKLDQALKDVQDYKSKYDKIKQEKDDLEAKLEQYKEDIDKMQELKNDNLRLKDENGALIRVISKLSRTPASSS